MKQASGNSGSAERASRVCQENPVDVGLVRVYLGPGSADVSIQIRSAPIATA